MVARKHFNPYYLCGTHNLAYFLLGRLNNWGFKSYQKSSRSVMSDGRSLWKQTGANFFDDYASESLYIFFQKDNDGQQILRLSNHDQANPKVIPDYEIHGSIVRPHTISYLAFLRKIAKRYQLQLPVLETFLLKRENYRRYAVRLQEITKEYRYNTNMNLPTRIVLF